MSGLSNITLVMCAVVAAGLAIAVSNALILFLVRTAVEHEIRELCPLDARSGKRIATGPYAGWHVACLAAYVHGMADAMCDADFEASEAIRKGAVT